MGITLEEYIQNIGTKLRFNSVKVLYMYFQNRKNDLRQSLTEIKENEQKGRYPLVRLLKEICDGRDKKLEAYIINALLNKQRPKIKKVVDDTKKYYSSVDINTLISTTIKMKNSYIEHTFFNRVGVIKFFCILEGWDSEIIKTIDEKVLNPIEYLYFLNLKNKKMLLDLGIYERDIEKIIKIIGDDFDDALDLKNRLLTSYDKLKNISFISKYVIRSLN
ncbi:MAG: hypothetical protein WCD89_18175 [Anaerocolumna sp.]